METISGKLSLSQWRSDGDTFAFKADDISAWNGLPVKVRPTIASPWVRVRLDACDTPELHSDSAAQSSYWGRAATQELADAIGLGTVSWSMSGNNPLNLHEVNCRLFVVGLDKFKRIIGVLFPETGDTDAADSVNIRLIGKGLAYPAIYQTTPTDLADAARSAWSQAIDSEFGFAPLDSTASFDMVEVATDQDEIMIQPKVWRRVNHYAQNYAGTESWEVYLKGRNDMLQPPTGTAKNLRKIMIRTGDQIDIAPDTINATWYVSGGLISSQILRFLATIAI